ARRNAYTEANCIAEEGTPCLTCSEEGSLTYPTFLPSYGPYGPYSPASYVVVPFLPLLCDVRRPRAGCSRPGVTVSGAPAKLLPTA
ncbi:hypothetical protein L249_5996, partial [Ophiocordyceps polyrhachis-furcata BCC 54312]